MFEQDNGSNNGSIYSKFRERLRNIKLSRIKKKRLALGNGLDKDDISVKKDSSNIGSRKNSLDEVIANIRSTSNDRNYGRKRVGILNDDNISRVDVLGNKVNNFTSKVVSNKKDDSLDETLERIRENKPKFRRSKRVGYVPRNKQYNVGDLSRKEREELLNNLGVEIIDKIKGNFEDKLDEIEVLISELYVISLKQDNELDLKKVEELKKKISQLIVRVNELIEQYNLYKRNYYIDNVIGIDDNIIVDDIINYRYLLDSFEGEKEFVKEVKAMEEFKSLYNNLVEVRDEAERLRLANEEKINEFDVRDKKYDNIKLEMVQALDIDEKCSLEIDRQNEYFDKLMSKIDKIESSEYVTLHLRGVGELLGSSLRFMGMLLISPFAGLVPGIAMHTMATRRMIANAYRHIHLEEVNHVRYEAIDYDSELNNHLNDVNYAECLVEDALYDIDRLREDFMSIYNSAIPGYEDTLKKIDSIEKKLMRNQNRVAIVKRNLKRSKKLNEAKLVRVREMNDNERAA